MLHPHTLHPDTLHATENAPTPDALDLSALSAEAAAAKIPASHASRARGQSIIRRAHPGHRRSTVLTLQFVFELWLGSSSSATRPTNA